MNSTSELYIITAEELRFVQANPAARANLGYSMEELAAMTLVQLQVTPGREALDALAARVLSGAESHVDYETAHRRRDGSEYLVEARLRVLESESPRLLALTVQDVTRRVATERKLKQFSAVIEQSPSAIVIATTEGEIEYVNPCFVELSGYSEAEVIGRNLLLIEGGETPSSMFREMWETVRGGEVWLGEMQNRKKSGEMYWTSGTVSAIRDAAGEPTHFIVFQHDITEQKTQEQRLNHLAYHDKLTDLPNRSLFIDRLHQAMVEAERHEHLVAVMYMDLDRFKTINDSLGHEAGDQLLREVAQRLKECVRASDTVSRMGGDEFTLILTEMKHISDAVRMAQKILRAVAEPFTVGNRQLHVTTSIGITIFPFDDNDIEKLIKNADTAMYSAKSAGKNCYQFYSAAMTAEAYQRLAIENSLHDALARDEFFVSFQPQIEFADCAIVGMSTVLQWRHPEKGMLDFADYVDIAEESGLIVSIGNWLLRAAAAQYRVLRDRGHGPLRLSVKLSAHELKDRGVVDVIAGVLRDMGGDPALLKLEITESLLMEYDSASAAVLQELVQLGVKLSIDDFGMGYSPLNHLKRFPIDTIKIDGSFIATLEPASDTAAIATAIINMAHSLGIKVLAEGVTSDHQFEFLRRQGCDMMQGGFYSEPVVIEEFAALLTAQRDCGRRVMRSSPA